MLFSCRSCGKRLNPESGPRYDLCYKCWHYLHHGMFPPKEDSRLKRTSEDRV